MNSEFLEEYKAYCAEFGTPDRIELMLGDINSILRGKWLPGDHPEKLAGGSVRLPLSTYAPNILGEEVNETGFGSATGDPDGTLVPITGTLRPVPWVEGNVAQVQVGMVDEEDPSGEVSILDPRKQLENVLKRFAARGLRPVVATELEFYIIQPRENETDAPMAPDRSPVAQNYDLEALGRFEDILSEILDVAKAQGMATDTLIAEYGPGQFEVNFHHTNDVLDAGDTAMMFRRLVRGVVGSHGLEATFMAKPYADQPGNGMHIHASLIDEDGNNVFSGDSETELSENLWSAVSGVLHTMPEMQAIFAPHMNSYRRFQPGNFAPSSPNWGYDHRGASVRLPDTMGKGARLEHRICGADVNPYLALAAVLGGILYGLDHKPELPLPVDHPDAVEGAPLTHDWITSVQAFEASDFAKYLFGDVFCKVYTEVRKNEIGILTTVITPEEYRAYLGRL
jgi:glutamine synthetase